MTFISVIRLVPLWFSPAVVPVVTQLTGMCGQLGQLFSVVPFALLLHSAGWTPAFMSLAAMSVLAVVPVLVLLRTSLPGIPAGDRAGTSGYRRLLVTRLKQPAPGLACGAISPSSSVATSLQ